MGEPAQSRQGQDDVRRRNLSTILRIVHRQRSTTRAELTRLTGLSRTSVGTLVAELERADLVDQTLPGDDRAEPANVGRPSPVVSVRDRVLTVAVNPDVTGVKVALVGLGGMIIDQVFRPTDSVPSPLEAAELTRSALVELRAGRSNARLVGLCAAIPGRVDKTGAVVTFAPHLRWAGSPFGQLLTEATGLSATVAFDARVALRAETLWGTAQAAADAVYFYGGPGGIGAAAMVDGHLLEGSSGAAARLGHTLVEPDGPACVCGNVGCLTTLVGHHQLAAACGLDRPTPATLREAILTSRSPKLRAFLDRQLRYVGTALRMAVWSYDPEQIVLGGFFSTLLEVGHDQLTAAVAGTNLGSPGDAPRLTVPTLGSDQLLVGAGAAAFEEILRDPAGALASGGS